MGATAHGEHRADVAIVGGGPAGAAAAISFAREGARVVLVERTACARRRVGETLPPSVCLPLRKLGVWRDFVEAGHLPSAGNRSAWGSSEARERHTIFDPYGPGWHVDRGAFDEMLLGAAERAGANVVRGARLGAVRRAAGSAWEMDLEAGEASIRVEARSVVDASGRSSVFARALGVRRRSVDRLVGIARYVRPVGEPPRRERFTLVEAAESGWWYCAGLPDGSLVVVFMTDSDMVRPLRAADPRGWRDLLARTTHVRAAVEDRAGGETTALRVEPANSSRLERVFGDGWIAAGDAAASFDPLSSQGISSALVAGISAAGAVRACLGGERLAFERYAAHCEREYDRYLGTRSAYYRIEKRWPDAPFWRRRGGDLS